MKNIKILLIIIVFSCQNKNIKETDFLYDKKGNQYVNIEEDEKNEIIMVNSNDTICENDTSETRYFPRDTKFKLIKLYDYRDFNATDSILVDTINQKVINIKETDVFVKDTLCYALICVENKNVPSRLIKGAIVCFLVKNKTNGVFHLIKKQHKTVIIKCDSLEKIKYYTPNLVFPKNN